MAAASRQHRAAGGPTHHRSPLRSHGKVSGKMAHAAGTSTRGATASPGAPALPRRPGPGPHAGAGVVAVSLLARCLPAGRCPQGKLRSRPQTERRSQRRASMRQDMSIASVRRNMLTNVGVFVLQIILMMVFTRVMITRLGAGVYGLIPLATSTVAFLSVFT